MQVTINLDEDDVRICKSIVADQTHFVINSTCIEDAVISGILTQISKKNIAPSKEDHSKEVHDNEKQMGEHEDLQNFYDGMTRYRTGGSPMGENI